MSGSLTIRDLRDGERAWANAQYRAIAFAPSPPDGVAMVAELAGARIGLGRLVVHAPGVTELGGIWTDEASRGRGVARAMVAALLTRFAEEGSRRRVWCIPFVHLAGFYQSFGFSVCAPPWPPPIAAKVAACVADGLPPVVVFAR